MSFEYRDFIDSDESITKDQKIIFQICLGDDSIQSVPTRYPLCRDVLSKVNSNIDLSNINVDILIMFNLEFVDILIHEFDVDPCNITFISDSKVRNIKAGRLGVEAQYIKIERVIENTKKGIPIMNKQFKVVLGNPPYQDKQTSNGKRGGGASLWDNFVVLAMDTCKKDGYISLIHPSRWRKPLDDLWAKMSEKNMLYLEIHNSKDGMETFRAGTRYDWYVMQNAICQGDTLVRDEDGKIYNIRLNSLPFLPNCRVDEVIKLLAEEDETKCKIIFDRRKAYGTDKEYSHTNEHMTSIHKYPLIHATNSFKNNDSQSSIRYWYSSRTDRGHFGISKVIFGESGINSNSIIDMDGKYGMTQGAMAIEVSSIKEARQVKKALDNPKFEDLLRTACSWSNFRIDWRLFKMFRKDFWKEFI